jgi:hypothetical protein
MSLGLQIREKKKKRRSRRRRRRRREKKSLPDFVGITVEGKPESLLRAFWGKKKIKSA